MREQPLEASSAWLGAKWENSDLGCRLFDFPDWQSTARNMARRSAGFAALLDRSALGRAVCSDFRAALHERVACDQYLGLNVCKDGLQFDRSRRHSSPADAFRHRCTKRSAVFSSIQARCPAHCSGELRGRA
ncbi:hypothetical protein G3N59_21920 [Paraburkholderia sp. Ac-20340]|uniref:hypothetical protein n=1 Tax=Paraburkholderia sp. Ac-20340 TaxID=2703888 RepID=UPI0019810A6F|nr:hypothetical protein [Paraburkholderia sp. Ac-20340]MBN3856039.1 hypothetical protein [Paraburkholderia sp. Ac-20340]